MKQIKYLLFFLSFTAFAQTNITIGSIARSEFYSINGDLTAPTRAKLNNPANFGPSGTYGNYTFTLVEIPNDFTRQTLLDMNIDIYWSGFDHDSYYTTAQLEDLEAWADNGGVVIAGCDENTFDPVCEQLGLALAGLNGARGESTLTTDTTVANCFPITDPIGNGGGALDGFVESSIPDSGIVITRIGTNTANVENLNGLPSAVFVNNIFMTSDVNMFTTDSSNNIPCCLSDGDGINNANDEFLVYTVAMMSDIVATGFSCVTASEPPTDILLDGANTDSVNEIRPVNSIVGRLTTTDPDTFDQHTYALVSGTGDTDNASFRIVGDKVVTNAVFDFETKNSYSIRVETTDRTLRTFQKSFTITINNIVNEIDAVLPATNTRVKVWNLNTAGDYTLSSSNTQEIVLGIQRLSPVFTQQNIVLDTGDSNAAQFADIDGDNDLDLFVVNNQQNKLWINNGSGSFVANDVSSDNDASTSAVIKDLDSDDDLDIFITNRNQQNKLWMNDGSGSFTAVTPPGGTATETSEGVIAFLADTDNDYELYVTNGAGQQNRLWINSSIGEFTPKHISGDTNNSQGARAGDLDGDGNRDLYVANYGQQNTLWMSTDGTGNFTTSNITGDLGNSRDVIFGDVDSDGDLDIYVVNDGGQQNRLWINDGSANFTASDISGDTNDSHSAVFVDIDADGDLDIYVGNVTQDNNLWINNGTGSFSYRSIPGDSGTTRGVAAANIDGSGFRDLYAANGNGEQNRVWLSGFTRDTPYLQPTTTTTYTSRILSFTAVLSANNEGSVSFQVSIDGGTSWNYWNGTAWMTTTATDGTQTSTAAQINTNISNLDLNGGSFTWRAYSNTTNGVNRVELDHVDITVSTLNSIVGSQIITP